ncbi:MAG: transcriptional repressor, partial [Myxococcota bacterium]
MNSVTELRTTLREHGLRATAARLAVLKCLANAEGPLSHSEVCSLLSDHGFDRATVYRNLVDLTERRILHRDDVGDHVWRFRFVSPSGSRPGSH